jgi:hypothetical protein
MRPGSYRRGMQSIYPVLKYHARAREGATIERELSDTD